MNEIAKRLERIEALLSTTIRDVLNVREVAFFLGKSESHIRHLAADRRIPHYKNDRGQLAFKKSEIEEWQLGTKVMTTDEIDIRAETYLATRRI